jgi:hypothetical protein
MSWRRLALAVANIGLLASFWPVLSAYGPADRDLAVRQESLPQQGTELRVREGEDVEGWRVTSIAPRKIHLRHSERRIDIPLDAPGDAR